MMGNHGKNFYVTSTFSRLADAGPALITVVLAVGVRVDVGVSGGAVVVVVGAVYVADPRH